MPVHLLSVINDNTLSQVVQLLGRCNLYEINLMFLISNFRHVLNVVCFLLGDSPASEFYMPTLRNTAKFCVLLTVHLGIILVNNHLDTQFFSVYVYFDTLRVSSSHVLS